MSCVDDWETLEQISCEPDSPDHNAEHAMIQRTSGNDLIAVWWDGPGGFGYHAYREKIGGAWEASCHQCPDPQLVSVYPCLGRRGASTEIHLIALQRPGVPQNVAEYIYDGVDWTGPSLILGGNFDGVSGHTAEDSSGTLHLIFAVAVTGGDVELYHASYDGAWSVPTLLDAADMTVGDATCRCHIDSSDKIYALYWKRNIGNNTSDYYSRCFQDEAWGAAELIYQRTGAFDGEKWTSFVDGNDQIHLISLQGVDFYEIIGSIGSWGAAALILSGRSAWGLDDGVGHTGQDGRFLFYDEDDSWSPVVVVAKSCSGAWEAAEIPAPDWPLYPHSHSYSWPSILLDLNGGPHVVTHVEYDDPDGEVYYVGVPPVVAVARTYFFLA